MNAISNRLLCLSLSLLTLFLPVFLSSTEAANHPAVKQAAQAKSKTETAKPNAADNQIAQERSLLLDQSLKKYREQPDKASFEKVFHNWKDFLSQPAVGRLSESSLLAAKPQLKELGLKAIDAGAARIWTFPRISECDSVIVQWQNVIPGRSQIKRVHGRKRIVKGPALISQRLQVIDLPFSITINAGRLVQSSVVLSTPNKKQQVKPEGMRALILVGAAKSGVVFLRAYKLTEAGFMEDNEIFASVLPYFLQNLIGKVSFSGNDLVLSIGGGMDTGKEGNQPDSKPIASSLSTSYRLVLHFVNNRYQLEGAGGEAGPLTIVEQFLFALQHDRQDLVKAWLIDPKLASIPKYLGLVGRREVIRVLPMTNPGNGSSRFRLVTSLPDDLIVDVGKIKSQWLIKALFIAPADPLVQKLLGNSAASQ